MADVIFVTTGTQTTYIGESIAFTIDTKGSVSGQGVDATPTAVDAANDALTGPDGTDASAQMSGSPSLSTDTITTPTFTLTSQGTYIYTVPMTVNGNTMLAGLKLLNKSPTLD